MRMAVLAFNVSVIDGIVYNSRELKFGVAEKTELARGSLSAK